MVCLSFILFTDNPHFFWLTQTGYYKFSHSRSIGGGHKPLVDHKGEYLTIWNLE